MANWRRVRRPTELRSTINEHTLIIRLKQNSDDEGFMSSFVDVGSGIESRFKDMVAEAPGKKAFEDEEIPDVL